ncbi:MAG: hypothetical protein RDU76_06275 [Candidatus Edwardsbacteria bacterium]|nr:hypothetical protein [Candidatus Edwardsbacteria bacterium]
MLTRAQVTNIMQEVRREAIPLYNSENKLSKLLKTNRINEKVANWNGNKQLVIEGQGLHTGALQGGLHTTSNIYLQNAAQAAVADAVTYNVAQYLYSLRYDWLLKKLKDTSGANMLKKQIKTAWASLNKMMNIAHYVGYACQVCAKATNSPGGSSITIPAGTQINHLFEGLAVEFADSGQPGWNGSSGLNTGYYGIISTITENDNGTVTLACVQSDLSTGAAFTAAHAEQPLYMLGSHNLLPYGMVDLYTKDNTIGSKTRTGRTNPISISADDDKTIYEKPSMAIRNLKRRVNVRGNFKCDVVLIGSQTNDFFYDKTFADRQRYPMDGEKTLLAMEPDWKVDKDLSVVVDPDMPEGVAIVMPSKNLWVAPLADDEPDYMDSEEGGLRVPGQAVGEIAIWHPMQMGLYDLGQIGVLTDIEKYF